MKNIEKYKKDLKLLIEKGDNLHLLINYECYPENIKEQIQVTLQNNKKAEEYIKELPPFNKDYQLWYS